MTSSSNIRLLTPQDAAVFREIRLRALKEHPDAFFHEYEEARAWPLEKIARFSEDEWIAGGFMQGALVGIAGLYRHKGLKTRHKGTVWGVYVAPEARGQRLGFRLIERALVEARRVGLELVQLSTDVSNDITVGLYKSLGFEPYGIEKHILKLSDGRYVDDLLMMQFLK